MTFVYRFSLLWAVLVLSACGSGSNVSILSELPDSQGDWTGVDARPGDSADQQDMKEPPEQRVDDTIDNTSSDVLEDSATDIADTETTADTGADLGQNEVADALADEVPDVTLVDLPDHEDLHPDVLEDASEDLLVDLQDMGEDAGSAICGDGMCQLDLGEDCALCPQDCGDCPLGCGDGVCILAVEDCILCPPDCGPCPPGCGDDICNNEAGEDCVTCSPDCGNCPPGCGNEVCALALGENCISCPLDCGPCAPTCWDGKCDEEVGEDCEVCPPDCGPCPHCGDGECTMAIGEICSTCPADCGVCPPGCGDGICQDELAEDCSNCPDDCGLCPTECGDGSCQQGEPLETAEVCPLDCGTCGDLVCGVNEDESSCVHDCYPTCGNSVCEEGESEDEPGHCPTDCGPCNDGICGYTDFEQGCNEQDCVAGCGDGLCDDAESPFQCPVDCGKPCGDGMCEPGETVGGCAVDCGICGDGVCGKWGTQPEDCPEDCSAPCGDGICWWGETAPNCPLDCGACGDGVCGIVEQEEASCILDCADCGDGICGAEEFPGTCPADCDGCVPFCAPEWECGDAGCGQLCGMCPGGSVCVDHVCCVGDCDGKQCGDDGCEGECGPCQPGAVCSEFQCVCSDDFGMESNDICLQATELGPGAYQNLNICQGGDEDWYLINVEAGKTLQIQAQFNNSDGDLDMYLFQPWNCAGHLAASLSHSDNEQITYTSPGSTFYLVRIVALTPIIQNSYDLTVKVGLPECGDGECHTDENCQVCPGDCGSCCTDCAPWESCVNELCSCVTDGALEPNDFCTQAKKLEPGLHADLAICSGGDQDWYTVHVETGETLQVTALFSNQMGNLDLYLYPHGNCVGYVAKAMSLTDDETIAFTSAFQSNYYIMVKGFGSATGATYDLNIELFAPGCGDGQCADGENCGTCPLDCQCQCGEDCVESACMATGCQGKQCGDDGCGNLCGLCGDQQVCLDSQCQCLPLTCDGTGKNCGTWDDACQGLIICGPDCPEPPFEVDIFLVAGQSNARGRGQGPSALQTPIENAWEYDSGTDALVPLQYPTGLPTGNYWTSDETSFVVSFGKKWFQATGRMPVFVCRAKGGTGLLEIADTGKGDWTDQEDNDGLFDTAAAGFQEALSHIQQHPDFLVGQKFVVWLQGENDANVAVPKSDYSAALVALLTRFGTELDIDAFLLAEIGYRLPYSVEMKDQFDQIIAGIAQAQDLLETAVLVSKMPRQFTQPCFASLEAPACALWDDYHYETWAYEALGKDMATNAANFFLTGVKPLPSDL